MSLLDTVVYVEQLQPASDIILTEEQVLELSKKSLDGNLTPEELGLVINHIRNRRQAVHDSVANKAAKKIAAAEEKAKKLAEKAEKASKLKKPKKGQDKADALLEELLNL